MIEPLLAGIIGVAALFVLLAIGLPIAVVLGLSGMVGIFLAQGSGDAISGLVFTKLSSVSLLAIPLFIFMGNLVSKHGLGADLYDSVYKWLGWIPGGLAIVSTVVSALFGFMCGSSIAGTATIGSIALTEMEKRGYNRGLAFGTLSLAGCLSAIIPPSVLMIIYAIQAECSMGWLFFAGIFPGLLLMTLMSLYIFTRVVINPEMAPTVKETFSIGIKMRSLVNLVPVIILFFGVLGGIYLGIWSPMEAGGVGTVLAFFIVLAYGRVSRKTLKATISDTTKTSVMIYLLIIGASILSLMFYVSGLSDVIGSAVTGLTIPRWAVIILMLFILMIMGMFMDALGMLFITLPVFLPIVLDLGYNIVWFGMIMIISCEMAVVTPPVGLHLFVIHGIARKGTRFQDIAIAIIPFVGVLWVLLFLLIAFPSIVMWLPNFVRG